MRQPQYLVLGGYDAGEADTRVISLDAAIELIKSRQADEADAVYRLDFEAGTIEDTTEKVIRAIAASCDPLDPPPPGPGRIWRAVLSQLDDERPAALRDAAIADAHVAAELQRLRGGA